MASIKTGPPIAWALAVTVLSTIGIGVSLYLTDLHLDLFYGEGVTSSLCDLGGDFNCSAVNASPESEIFGIPQSVLAIPVYGLSAALGWWSTRRRRGAAVLAALSALSVVYSAWLAWVSATVIGAWCAFCVVLYGVNLSLLVLGVWAGRLSEVKAATLVRPALTSVVAGGVLLGASLTLYDLAKRKAAAQAVSAVSAAAAQTTAATSGGSAAANTDSATTNKKVKLGVGKEVKPPVGAPSRGPANARVTIVEFSDFQCPFCKRLSSSLEQLVSEYPNDVRLVFVHFPLNLDCNARELQRTMHPEACAAAVAADCADKQGRFWEMHDALFANQGSLARKTYLKAAKDLALDLGTFEACLADPAANAAVKAATAAGVPLGVSGTPSFFVNGRVMSGAQPIEVLRAVVDAELAGNKAALDLEVAIGTETLGDVSAPASVAISALPGRQIDSFEASLDGKVARSVAGADPARGVSWFEADAACNAADKRLCTEKEWLAACTGALPEDADGNGVYSDDSFPGPKYGYGEHRRSGACADTRNPASPGDLRTGIHPKCNTADGAFDMLGGVKEWVGLTPANAALKGGSYSSGESARCGYFRDDIAADVGDASNGFRCCTGEPEPPPPPLVAGRDVGEKLSSFKVPLVDGEELDSRKLAGKPTILTFWASWCGPCQKEMPALADLYSRYKSRGLMVLGVSVDSDEAKRTTWLGAHPMPFLIGKDPQSTLMNGFPNRALPTTFWIRRDGVIRLRTTGLPPGGDKRLEELVVELVGGEVAPKN